MGLLAAERVGALESLRGYVVRLKPLAFASTPLLPRWETSTGAVAERDYALSIGTPVITSLDELRSQ